MKKRGRRVARSGAEEVVEGHFGLDRSPVSRMGQPIRRDHGQVYRRARLGHIRECARLAPQLPVVVLVNDKRMSRILDLTDIDNTVRAFDQQVNLHPRRVDFIRHMPPGIHFCQDSRYSKRHLDLRDMLKTEPLEGQPAPDIQSGTDCRVRPEVLVMIRLTGQEPKVKQREIVDKLKLRVVLPLAIRSITANETALLKRINQPQRAAPA